MSLSFRSPGTHARRLAAGFALLSLGLAASGCGNEAGEAPQDGSTGLRGRYEVMSQGTAEQLARHIEEMKSQFGATNERGPSEARQAQLAFTDAVAGTAAALLEQPGLTPQQRDWAALAQLATLRKRLESFPNNDNLERFLSAADAIAAKFPKTETATRALYAKVDMIENAPMEVLSDLDTRVDRLTAAGLAVGQAEPPYPEAADLLIKLAPLAERIRKFDRAKQMYALLVDRYAQGDSRFFAEGNLRRLEGIGRPVGEFRGPKLDGSGMVDLKDLRGKVVLVDFWASYCGPCAKEIPDLAALRERLGPEGFEIVGVNIDRDLDAAKAFVEKSKSPWPQLAVAAEIPKDAAPATETGEDAKASGTPEGTVPIDPTTGPSELETRYGVNFIPLKLLIDRDGTLVGTGYGLDTLQPEIEKLFRKEGEPAAGESKPEGK
jgi:thiol-disulfide isomerase/thioredoxin